MTARTRLRSLGACTLFVVAIAGFSVPGAGAHPPTNPVITTPGSGVTVSKFLVIADVRARDDDTLTGISLTLSPLDQGSKQEVIRATNTSGSFPVEVEWNGKYEAAVNATSTYKGGLAGLGAHGSEVSTTTRRQFSVAAPPAAPTEVRAVVDSDSRGVALSWKANAEKDMLFYLVQRAKGDGAYSPLGKTDGPGETSIVDPSTAEAAGEYRYQVVAVRRGSTADEPLNSDPSRPATASVPGPAGPAPTGSGGTTGTTPGAAGPGTSPSGTTGATLSPSSPGALKKSGTLDLSGFSSIKSQARRPAVRSVVPDPGFTNTLPFATTDTTRLVDEDEQAAAPTDEPEVRELGAEDASNNRQRSAAFLAAGLLATVLLMHLLWIRGEVQREPLETLVPE